jgi:molybdate transport system ATP-binding protein
VAGTPLLARLTARSADALGLAAGSVVYAQVKSVAVIG